MDFLSYLGNFFITGVLLSVVGFFLGTTFTVLNRITDGWPKDGEYPVIVEKLDIQSYSTPELNRIVRNIDSILKGS